MHLLLLLKISTAVSLRTTLELLITDFNKSVYRYVCPISHMELVMPPKADTHPFQHAKNHVSATTHQLFEHSDSQFVHAL